MLVSAKHQHDSAISQSVQSLSCVQIFAIPWIAACQATLSTTNSRSLPKFMSIESGMPSNHLILYRPLLLLATIFPRIRVFTDESGLCMRWPKYWSFSFSISPSNEHPGLISFRMDWLDPVPCSPRDSQESSPTPQFKSINSSVLSFLYGPALTSIAGKTIALTRWTFVDKVMSLLFNTLFRLAITFLPRGKRLLILWLQSPSAVILELKKIKSATLSLFPHLLPWSDRTGCHDLSFLNVEL